MVLLRHRLKSTASRTTSTGSLGMMCTALLVFTATSPAVVTAWPWDAVTPMSDFSQFEQYWSDPSDIITTLSQYEVLWIKPHGCVWSECSATDPTDDAYMGDNRDGDEQWYLQRTSSFCANAAYSLYGVPRETTVPQWLDSLNACRKAHFINSYFTYGGADTLLKAVGIEPNVYYGEDYYNNQGGNGRHRRYLEDAAADAAAVDDAMVVDDDAYAAGGDDNVNNENGVYYSNADCIEVSGADVTHYSYNRNNNNGEGGGGGGGQGENNEMTYMSTVGCSADGTYEMARFEAQTCDGNSFLDTLDSLDAYNAQHDDIGCYRIWDRSDSEVTKRAIIYLMKDSWTCNMDLYPDGCPDPYGRKAKFLHALETAAQNGNAKLSLKNMNAQRPVRLVSLFLAFMAVLTVGTTYFFKNHQRITDAQQTKHQQGDQNSSKKTTFRGSSLLWSYCQCLWEDVCTLGRRFKAMCIAYALRKGLLRHKRSGQRAKTESKEERTESLIKHNESMASTGGGPSVPAAASAFETVYHNGESVADESVTYSPTDEAAADDDNDDGDENKAVIV